MRNACSFGLFLLSCCFVFHHRPSPPRPPPPPVKKGTCILTLIKREKRETSRDGSEALWRSPLSNLRSRTAVTAQGGALVIWIRLPLFSTHQPTHIKTINYGSNEGSFFLHSACPPALLHCVKTSQTRCPPGHRKRPSHNPVLRVSDGWQVITDV